MRDPVTGRRAALRVAACLVLGILIGAVAAMLQTWTLAVAGVRLPLGMALGLVSVVLVARACAWWVGSRSGAIGFGVGWLAATLMMGTTTPGGDLVLSSGTRQMAYLVLGTMLLAAASGFPLLPEDDDPEALPARPAEVGTDG